MLQFSEVINSRSMERLEEVKADCEERLSDLKPVRPAPSDFCGRLIRRGYRSEYLKRDLWGCLLSTITSAQYEKCFLIVKTFCEDNCYCDDLD
ncbi:hypothetical protein OESDEN_18777 [Oesophagostomum dentatum]|uniref:Uncharacterized protein n=1 Tax=Oesophagostomum dentatum TaxID=61180 RepID=A0A0B1SDD6_OESDE|nr:hypothetical protein OESDEN_18777 [Oesophagostomum dentatum]